MPAISPFRPSAYLFRGPDPKDDPFAGGGGDDGGDGGGDGGDGGVELTPPPVPPTRAGQRVITKQGNIFKAYEEMEKVPATGKWVGTGQLVWEFERAATEAEYNRVYPPKPKPVAPILRTIKGVPYEYDPATKTMAPVGGFVASETATTKTYNVQEADGSTYAVTYRKTADGSLEVDANGEPLIVNKIQTKGPDPAKLVWQNIGAFRVGLHPVTGEEKQRIAITLTPDQIADNARQAAMLKLDQDKFEQQKLKDAQAETIRQANLQQTALDKFNAAVLAKATQQRLGLTGRAAIESKERLDREVLAQKEQADWRLFAYGLSQQNPNFAQEGVLKTTQAPGSFPLLIQPGGLAATFGKMLEAGAIFPEPVARAAGIRAPLFTPGETGLGYAVGPGTPEFNRLIEAGQRPRNAGNIGSLAFEALPTWAQYQSMLPSQRAAVGGGLINQADVEAAIEATNPSWSGGLGAFKPSAPFGTIGHQQATKSQQAFAQGQAMSDPISAARIRRSWAGREGASMLELAGLDKEIARLETEAFSEEKRKRREAESEAARPFRVAAARRSPFFQRG